MTENTEKPTTPVPPGRDLIDDLTAAELGTVGRLIKCDPYEAVAGGDPDNPKSPAHGQRWPAIAHLLWCWAKRSNPKEQLQPWLDKTVAELADLVPADPDAEGEDDDENPSDSTPA